MQEKSVLTILSFLPVILLVILSLLKNIRIAAVAGFITTTILFFIWKAGMAIYFASIVAAMFSTLQILMIVFGAILLYETMKASGYIENISQSIMEINAPKETGFFLIAIGLTGFFEGVAGFGTPGAIVPLLLISMGFDPLLSVSAVLLFDGLFAAFGAVGTPLLAGLKTPLALSETEILSIGSQASILLFVAGLILLLFIIWMYQKTENKPLSKRGIFAMYFAAFLPFGLFSFWVPEYATILSSAIMLAGTVLFVTKGKLTPEFKAWIPYLILVALLLLPKMIGIIRDWQDLQIKWNSIFSSPVSASLKPLKSPLFPFLAVSLLFVKSRQIFTKSISAAGKKLFAVAAILLPIIAVAQLMMNSGTENPSMVYLISHAFSQTKSFYVFVAPQIGILGAFITGSSTVSNIVFGPAQMETAQLLLLQTNDILALQLAGSSIGNAVCLFNIIAACTVAGMKEPNNVLMKNLWPTLLAGIAVGLLGYLLL